MVVNICDMALWTYLLLQSLIEIYLLLILPFIALSSLLVGRQEEQLACCNRVLQLVA